MNAPTANTVAAAEHGIALMCALSRNVAQADASMKQQKWERNKYVGVSLVDKTLAIMGFGKVWAMMRACTSLGFHRGPVGPTLYPLQLHDSTRAKRIWEANVDWTAPADHIPQGSHSSQNIMPLHAQH